MVSIPATLDKQERVKISKRTMAGLERVKATVKTLGRRKKGFDREKVRQLRQVGRSLEEISREIGISRAHVHRLVRGANV